ncbi:MAG: hypothetical protein Q6K35_02990, partial [Thermostichus sp. DG02_4_bins_136]
MHRFTREGGAVIFISHKLKEVMQISGRITVIRDGKVVATLPTAATHAQELARLRVGREVSLTVDKDFSAPQEVLLDVQEVRLGGTAQHFPDGTALLWRHCPKTH